MQVAIVKPGMLLLVVALGAGCSSSAQSSQHPGQDAGASLSDASADRDSGAPLLDASAEDAGGSGAPVHCSTGGATCEANGCCYVTPNGAGQKTGTDWNNAYADLPASLTRGVAYFLAGSTTNYRSHVFDDPDQGTTPIMLYKAVDCKTAKTVFTCSSPSPACGTGQGTISDNAGSSVVKNMVFYNNTVAVGYPAGSYLLSPDSSGAVVENNLFYDIPGTNAVRLNGTHDYNTLLNASLVYYAKCQPHETCISSGASDPFVNDKGFDFHLKADMSAAASAGTEAAQGVALGAPYDVDFDGRARGADGTWERGAYEF